MSGIHSLISLWPYAIMPLKEGAYMRITKEPEERRQEILKTAIALFSERGYEKTSIGDIAKEMNVAQGLCYRYFPSKEVLFDTAVDQYAQRIADKIAAVLQDGTKSVKQIILDMPGFVEAEKDPFYELFHKKANEKIHNQLSLKVCDKLFPVVKGLLERAAQSGEINMPDIETAASFCVFGQLGILLRQDLTETEKERRIREFLLFFLNFF